MNTQWEKIVQHLAAKLEPGVLKVWIQPLEATISEGRVHLLAPKPYMAQWIKKKLLPDITDACNAVLGGDTTISLEAKPKESVAKKKAADEPTKRMPAQNWLPFLAPSKKPLPKRTWRYSFSDFVVGASNQMAVAAAQDVCRTNGDVQTLYVNAQSGLGKTHLVQAVGQNLSEDGKSQQRVDYVTADEFSARYIASIKTNDVEAFKESMRSLDVLLFEDVHFLQNKPKTQETALSVVKSIQEQGGRVIFTSSFSPRELQKVDAQLVSSFCSGILTHIDKPNEDMRAEIVQRKAQAQKVLLSDSVCSLLAQRLDGDVRQLESCLNSLLFKANLLHTEITPQMALDVLQEYASAFTGPDLTYLAQLVCEYLGLEYHTLQTKSRCQNYVLGRNTIFYLARKHTDLTLKEIGTPFNRRHSTVLQGITQVERELANSSTQGRQIARVVALIEERMGLAK